MLFVAFAWLYECNIGISVKQQVAILGNRYDQGMTAFGEMLVKYVKYSRFRDVKTFAKSIGSSQSYLSRVINGLRNPPLDRIDEWARALEMEQLEAPRFRNLAEVAHLPQAVQPKFVEFLERFETCEFDLERAKLDIKGLSFQLDSWRSEALKLEASAKADKIIMETLTQRIAFLESQRQA
jgi:transcriptional regulator with XRE-family HTH domain